MNVAEPGYSGAGWLRNHLWGHVDVRLVAGTSTAQSEVVFDHFKGKENNNEHLDRKNFIGSLPRIVEDARRELLVKALLHRRLGVRGQARILLLENRLEFHSPSRLPNGETIEKMKESSDVPPNPILMKFMQDDHSVEKTGRGIPMVFRELKEVSARAPGLTESGEEFIVTLDRGRSRREST